MDLAYDPTPRDRDAERLRGEQHPGYVEARRDAAFEPILSAAGTGPILEPEPADPAAAAEAAVLRASRTDWRAASWWLEHSPSTREQWSDAARAAAIRNATIARVVAGIERWASAQQIPPQTVRTLLLHLQAAGTAALDEASD